MEESEKPLVSSSTRNAHLLFFGGVIVSILYLAAMGTYAWSVWSLMIKMSPDEFATFLSGAFAPLAFLWLVLGFRQQGDELQNSARALWLQGEELRNSVEQQRQLVEVSREQLSAEYSARLKGEEDADRAAQPQLMLVSGGGSYSGPRRSLGLRLSNAGPNCSDVKITANGKEATSRSLFTEGAEISFSLDYAAPEDVEPLTVDISYNDRRGNRRMQSWSVPVSETGGPNGDRTLGEAINLPGYKRL